jgi:cytochrome P450
VPDFLRSVRTILLAGHETSATSLCWILLELAQHPEVQTRLRAEIRSTEQAIHARGGSDLTASDLESMPYLTAVLKARGSQFLSIALPRESLQECMRFHPAVYQNYRQAAGDDVLPLSKSIKTSSGDLITQLPIPKGMKIIASIAGYNRSVT